VEVASTLGNLGRCLGRLGAWKASRRPRRQFAPSRPLGAPTDVSMLDALEKQHEEDKAARKEAIKDVNWRVVNYVKGLVALVDVGDTTPLNVFFIFSFLSLCRKIREKTVPAAAYSRVQRARGTPSVQ
jgi:hypothetical protein